MDIINKEKAARLMDGDKDLYRELMAIIENTLDEKFNHLEKALAEHSPEDLEMFAHQFKGALRNVAADECCFLLEKIEKCGVLADFVEARTLYDQVRPAVNRLLALYHEGSWEAAFVV